MEDPVHVTLNTYASAMSPCVDITGPNRENVSSAKLGHVIGNGVQFTGGPDRPSYPCGDSGEVNKE